MIFDYETLKLIWWVLIGTLLIGFAITDGMDMGAGMLLPLAGKTNGERRVIINSVAPHWDGNQVWLITAGGAIFAAWPSVYAASFSGFYLAMLLALAGLFLRPVGFEYRSKVDTDTWRMRWDWALFAGSLIPALIFGVAFGNLLQGVPFRLDEFLRPSYDGWFIFALIPLLNPFALLAGIVSVTMLMLHGGVWVQKRSTGELSQRVGRLASLAGLVAIAGFVLAGLWIWLGNADWYRIVSQPDFSATPNPLGKEVMREAGGLLVNYTKYPITIAAPTLGIAGMALAILLSKAGRPGAAYLFSSLGVTGVISTAGVSMFPFVMPSSSDPVSSFTVWDATSSHFTLTVMFWAVALLLPFVLGYTLWCYRRMWGPLTVEDIEARQQSFY